MDGDRCKRPGCPGTMEDGYCDICGHAEAKGATSGAAAPGLAAPGSAASGAAAPGLAAGVDRLSASVSRSLATGGRATSPTATRASAITGTGSSPTSHGSGTSRRTRHTSSRTTRKQLGAGLIQLPDLPSLEPEKAILAHPGVPERKRFCARCDAPLKREAGFCGKCGTRYNFVPSLKAGDLVANQYEVRGPIAFGGLGWIYLAFDKLLSRYVVLKGLLNAQDESAAAAAVAERQFLATVKHPNIVGIYNFVQSGTEGYIVMEYVGGKTLKQIRQERGPLPVAEAIAYMHRILPAFAYLHRLGLVYCDFKPDNIMLEKDDVKLIDLGGVRREDDTGGDIYGTVGYSAPEAGEGPTPASDLFTVGRTLLVLLCEVPSFSRDHRYTLPSPAEAPVFDNQESLYRALLKSTAEKADDRFEDADEMTEQLLGVLREVVAVETGTPRPGASASFGVDLLALDAGNELDAVLADARYLPVPSLDMADAGAQAVANALALPQTAARLTALRATHQAQPKSREAALRLAGALTDAGEFAEAEPLLQALGESDPWDWRVPWFQARLQVAESRQTPNRLQEARRLFDQVYFDLPGELAPKLALGFAAEATGDLELAGKMYDLVSRTDPAFVSAVFGLARARLAAGDRKGAVAALERIGPGSSFYVRSRVAAARLLVGAAPGAPALEDLASASAMAQTLTLGEISKATLQRDILLAAVDGLGKRSFGARSPSNGAGKTEILGEPLEERTLRFRLESSLRSMARFASGAERVRMVDEANRVRPRTLL